MQSLKIDYLQGFYIIDLAFKQSGPGCEFFSVWCAVAVPSRVVDFFARPGTHAASCITTSCIAAVDGGAWGASFCAMESVTISSERRRVEGRCLRWSLSRLRSAADGGAWRAGGCCRDPWSIYGAKKSPDRAGDRETRAIGLLLSRPRLGNYAKFALSFAKLPKMQSPNAKSLDTSFCDFWQIIRMQTQMQNRWRCSRFSITSNL